MKTTFEKKKMLIYLLLVSIGFVGVVNYKSPTRDSIRLLDKHNRTNDEFKRYVDYLKIINPGTYAKSIKVGFDDMGNTGVAGTCNYVLIGNKFEIDIDRDYWMHADDMARLILLAHELIHCSCKNFRHNNTTIPGSYCADNIFNSSIPDEYCRRTYPTTYMLSIFRGCKN